MVVCVETSQSRAVPSRELAVRRECQRRGEGANYCVQTTLRPRSMMALLSTPTKSVPNQFPSAYMNPKTFTNQLTSEVSLECSATLTLDHVPYPQLKVARA